MIRKDSSTMILLSWGRDVESTSSRQEKEVLRGISFKKKKKSHLAYLRRLMESRELLCFVGNLRKNLW